MYLYNNNHLLIHLAVVEHVRDGCTLRVITLKSFQVLTVAMTGIKV